MKKKYLTSSRFLLLLLFTLCSARLEAQGDFLVKGTVSSAEDGETLIGANVIEINANNRVLNGTVTDFNGNFSIKVADANAKIKFTYIGFQEKVISVKGRNSIKVVLEVEGKNLETVVIGGKVIKRQDGMYGNTQIRKLGTAVTKVELKDIASTPVTSVDQLLQGQAAGLHISAMSGDPGATSSIRIRGTTSLTGSNDPLIVVDGIPTEIDGSLTSADDLMDQAHSPLSDINPEDIESIDILKDAASTAVYGSRAANGVILIKTKRGVKGKTNITYSNNFSLTRPPKHIPLLDGPGMKILVLEEQQGAGMTSFSSFPQLRDDPDRNDYYYFNKNIDWVDEIEKNGLLQNHTLSVRGGGTTTSYAFSVGYTNQTGTVQNTGYDRLTTRFNLDYNISDKLRFGSSTAYTYSRTNEAKVRENHFPLSMGIALQYPPFVPIYEQDKFGNNLDAYYVPPPTSSRDERKIWDDKWFNPVAFSDYKHSYNYNNRFMTQLYLEYEIIKNLKFRTFVSLDYSDSEYKGFVPSSATGVTEGNSIFNYQQTGLSYGQSINQENVLTYTKLINEAHTLSFVIAGSAYWKKSGSISNKSSNGGSEKLMGVSATNDYMENPSSTLGQTNYGKLMASFNYDYKDRYLFHALINREGSSKFGEANRYGNFPAASLAWRVSNEPFMDPFRQFISDLKLRYSYGVNGNPPPNDYTFISRYSAQERYMNQSGVRPDNIQLNKLKWEETTQHNFGIDISLFSSRLNITAEYYRKLTVDALMEIGIPKTSGFDKMWMNFADIRNRGIELFIQGKPIQKTKFQWSFDFNIARNRNKVVKLPGDRELHTGWAVGNPGIYPIKVEVGDQIGTFYGFKYLGVYPTDEDAIAKDADGNKIVDINGKYKYMRFNNENGKKFQGGDAIYEDLNHDGVINDQDRTVIGDANPDFFGGLRSTFNIGNFKIQFFFQYNVGNDIISESQLNSEKMEGVVNQSTAVLRRWRKQGDITDIPRAVFTKNNNHNHEGSDRFVQDGSYCRLKNITFSYDVPRAFCEKIGIKTASIFLNAYNLYTWTNYVGQDPEVGFNSKNPLAVGIENARTAQPKYYSAGLKINFK